MKTILVATDFSNASRAASLYAEELAKISDAKILLCHAHNQAAITTSEALIAEENQIESSKDESQQLLEAEAVFLSKLNGVEVGCLLAEGSPIKELLVLEEEEKPDLLIVGMKESEALSDFIFGSVITDLIKETQTPVLVIPEKCVFKKPKKIAFAFDFEVEAEFKMHAAVKELIRVFDSEILILNIIKPEQKILPDNKTAEFNIEKYFENYKHVYYFIQDNDLINGLKEFVATNEIDMLTMFPHKQNLLEKIFEESKTKQMAFNTVGPLLILPVDYCSH